MEKIGDIKSNNDMVLKRLDGSTIDVSHIVKDGQNSQVGNIYIKCAQNENKNNIPNRSFGNVMIFDETPDKSLNYKSDLGFFNNITHDITIFACDVQAYKDKKYDIKGVYEHEKAHKNDIQRMGLEPINKKQYIEMEQKMAKEEQRVIKAVQKTFGMKIKSAIDLHALPKSATKSQIQSIEKKYKELKTQRENFKKESNNIFMNKKYSSTEVFTAAYEKDLKYQEDNKLDPNLKDMSYFLLGTTKLNIKIIDENIGTDASGRTDKTFQKRSQAEVYAEMMRLKNTGKTRFEPGVFEEYFPNVYKLVKGQ